MATAASAIAQFMSASDSAGVLAIAYACAMYSECGEVFGELLAKAISDGTISPEERNQLDAVAKTLGMSVRDVVQAYFVRTAEGFLRAVFTRAIEDGLLMQDEWQRFLQAAVQLGFTQAEARKLVQPYSQEFVEHVLTDAKADGKLSDRESQSLTWLLDQLSLSSEFRRYVTQEVQSLRTFTNIQEGKLPVLNDFALVELRAGEIPHAHVGAKYQFTRQRRSGAFLELHDGTLTITDARAVFSSPQKSFHLSHGQVLMCLPVGPGLLEIRTGASKGAGFYTIEDHPELITAIWKTALVAPIKPSSRKSQNFPVGISLETCGNASGNATAAAAPSVSPTNTSNTTTSSPSPKGAATARTTSNSSAAAAI